MHTNNISEEEKRRQLLSELDIRKYIQGYTDPEYFRDSKIQLKELINEEPFKSKILGLINEPRIDEDTFIRLKNILSEKNLYLKEKRFGFFLLDYLGNSTKDEVKKFDEILGDKLKHFYLKPIGYKNLMELKEVIDPYIASGRNGKSPLEGRLDGSSGLARALYEREDFLRATQKDLTYDVYVKMDKSKTVGMLTNKRKALFSMNSSALAKRHGVSLADLNDIPDDKTIRLHYVSGNGSVRLIKQIESNELNQLKLLTDKELVKKIENFRDNAITREKTEPGRHLDRSNPLGMNR